ncbi:MAG: hypothetical protein MHM6MM_002118 [Cercozoa sp. M6MM]
MTGHGGVHVSEIKEHKFASFVARRPCTVIGIVLAVIIALGGIIGGAGLFEFADSTDMIFWLDINSVWTQRQLSVEYAQTEASATASKERSNLRVQPESRWDLLFMYRDTEYDAANPSKSTLLTPEKLKVILDFEKKTNAASEMQTFCFAGNHTDGTCAKAEELCDTTSFASCLDSVHYLSFVDYLDRHGMLNDQAAIDNFVANNKEEVALFMDNHWADNAPRSGYLRSFFKFGGPISSDYKSIDDDFDAQSDEFIEWMKDFMVDVKNDIYQSTDGMEIIVFGMDANTALSGIVGQQQFMWAFGSMAFVLCYIWFHTGSLMLAACGMGEVVLALPLAFFFFRCILLVTYFETLHMLSMFVVLGISADNFFLITDMWRQSARIEAFLDTEFVTDSERANQSDEKMHRLAMRTSFVWRRSVRAIAATTMTTVMAFIATGTSEITPISSLGFFASMFIFANFLLCMTFFFGVLLFWHKHLRRWRFLVFALREQSPDTLAAGEKPIPVVGQEGKTPSSTTSGSMSDEESPNDREAGGAVEGGRPIEKFFRGPFFEFVYKCRYGLIVVFLAWFVASIVLTTGIKEVTEQEQFYPDDHFLTKMTHWPREHFGLGANAGFMVVQFVYGLDEEVERSGISRWKPQEDGTPKFLKTFNPKTPAAQAFMIQSCDMIANNELIQNDRVQCWPKVFRDFVNSAASGSYAGTSFGSLSASQFNEAMRDFVNTPDGRKEVDAGRLGVYPDDTENVLHWYFIESAMTAVENMPKPEAIKTRGQLEDWMTETLNPAAPPEMRGVFQVVPMWWPFIVTQDAFVRNAISGMLISGAFSLVVILTATGNLVAGFLAFGTIAAVVVSVLGFIRIFGWPLGTTESVAVVVVIGFSVDYTVHLASAYEESSNPSRIGRTRDALSHMAISLVAGCITTAGSALFLMFAEMVFFFRFGVLMMLTVFLSILWCLLFFVPMLACFGPEGENWQIRNMFLYSPFPQILGEKRSQVTHTLSLTYVLACTSNIRFIV